MVRVDAGRAGGEAIEPTFMARSPGDPAKLGGALVEIARMENPPKLFVAGADPFGPRSYHHPRGTATRYEKRATNCKPGCKNRPSHAGRGRMAVVARR